MSESLYTCLCLGVTPGQGCGNDGIGGDNTGVFLNVPKSVVDSQFQPDRTPNRTGWVAVQQESYTPFSATLQLVRMLAAKGILSGDEPYDVFNQSTPIRVRHGDGGDFTCLCMGVNPGQGCGNAGIGGDNAGVFIDVSQNQLDSGFHPDRTPNRTGWVAVKQASYSPFAVLLQLVQRLASGGVLEGDEPYDVFNRSTPIRVRQGGGGNFTLLCMGVAPGQGCGNGGIGGDNTGVFVNVSQSQIESGFHPNRTPNRTGWVAVEQEAYIPYSVLLQLTQILVSKGHLSADQPYDVFNESAPVRVRRWEPVAAV